MNRPLYTTEILRLAASLSEPRELEREDGKAELRSPTCGSRVTLIVQLDEERRIEAISQKVQACAFGQASAGRAKTVGPLLTLGVAYGGSMSVGVILRLTPAASLRQSPYAAVPVKTDED